MRLIAKIMLWTFATYYVVVAAISAATVFAISGGNLLAAVYVGALFPFSLLGSLMGF